MSRIHSKQVVWIKIIYIVKGGCVPGKGKKGTDMEGRCSITLKAKIDMIERKSS